MSDDRNTFANYILASVTKVLFKIRIESIRNHLKNLPCNDNDEVHDIPCVSQVTATVKNKAQGQNFQGRLNSKNAQEIGLRGFLEKQAFKSGQGWANCDLRAKSGPPRSFVWPV